MILQFPRTNYLRLGHIPGFKSRDRNLLTISYERRISMDKVRNKLTEEIGELALRYDMNYIG